MSVKSRKPKQLDIEGDVDAAARRKRSDVNKLLKQWFFAVFDGDDDLSKLLYARLVKLSPRR